MGEPRERPILFSAPMVRALLDGRKTQTRRVCGVYQSPHGERDEDGWPLRMDAYGDYHREVSPYGQPGDRLWVRETWGWEETDPKTPGSCWYRADPCTRDFPGVPCEHGPSRWRPSIHMPHWASRLTLEVTNVRVERLQDISEEDARAEGMAALTKDGRTVKYGLPDRDGLPGTDNDGMPWGCWNTDARRPFKLLWERINGATSWHANPWVWAVSFRRVEASR